MQILSSHAGLYVSRMFHGIGGVQKYFFKKLFQKNFSVRTNRISPVLAPLVVCFGVTLTAQQFEVIPIKSDLRIVDRDRIYFDSMVNYLTRLVHATPQTVLAQIGNRPSIFVSAILPAFRTVELPSVFLSHRSASYVCPNKRTSRSSPDCERTQNFKQYQVQWIRSASDSHRCKLFGA